MDKKKYDKQLIKWVRGHYWDSLEKDKDLILRHLRNFTGDEAIYVEDEGQPAPLEVIQDTPRLARLPLNQL